MKSRPSTRVAAKPDTSTPRLIATGSAILIGAAIWAGQADADGHDPVTVTHGYSNFDELVYPADFPHFNYVNPDAPKGGEISQWAQGTFDSFNMSTRKGTPAALATIGYESILMAAADDAYGAYCYLCTTMEYPQSRDWVIFNLRDDVTFSDGTGMTAEDLKFSFELYLEQGITEYREVYSRFIDSVEVMNPYKIKFTFTEDAPRRDVVTWVGGTSAFSKAWWEDTGARLDESTDAPFMGTGPYLLDTVDIGRQLVYRKDPNWWGADHPASIGRNNFETIRVEYFADSAAAFEGFKSGAYTFRSENSSKQWATGYDFPAVDNGWVKVEELPNGAIGSAQSFVFNLDNPTWQDPWVRDAVALMFNFEWSNESLFYGLYARVNSFWQNSDLEAKGTPTEGELAILQPLVEEGFFDASILTDEVRMAAVSSTSQRPLDRGNLRRASALLDEAGWLAGDDGVRRKDGQTLDAVFLQYSPQFDRIVNPMVENLKRLGVNASLERVDTSQYIERRRSGDFDLVNHTLTQGFEPGQQLRQWFGSEAADDSSRNIMRLRSEGVDRVIDAVVAAEELADIQTAARAMDRVLRAEGFWIPQWFKDTHTVAYYDQYRFPDELPPFALGTLDFWWYDADAAAALNDAGALQ
ncbi:MAG: extracellular solute-binding protein [Yoonia sp.]|nr:extracellular solute-binding protein [Yoonia sp.]MDG1519711.1 extracellular solute-binding protein [Yoonia sp.]MDG1768571.1 extracellular solute-binding protein [Yoonia sp.]